MKWLPVPERAEVVRRALPPCRAAVLVDDRRDVAGIAACATPRRRRRRPDAVPGAAVVASPPLSVRPCGTAARCAERSAGEVVGQIARRERRAHRHHPATDIDADRRGNDRALGRNDRTDRRAHAPVDVRHHGHVMMNERQRRHVEELRLRRILERNTVDPRMNRRATLLNDLNHVKLPGRVVGAPGSLL